MGSGHLNLSFREGVSLEKANIMANKGEKICMFFILHKLKNKCNKCVFYCLLIRRGLYKMKCSGENKVKSACVMDEKLAKK